MNITIKDTFDHRWRDYTHCTCWFENLKSQIVCLSKKKMLKFFSEKEKLDEFHLLLLDNIIQTRSFDYYTEDGEFTISMYGGKRIVVTIPQKYIEDIVGNCTADPN